MQKLSRFGHAYTNEPLEMKMNFWLDVYERKGDKRALGIIKVKKKFQFHTFCREQSAETIRNSHVVVSATFVVSSERLGAKLSSGSGYEITSAVIG